jgi:hypothetical protein
MTHMLIVAARQLCNPVVFLVFMIASDGLFHKLQSRKRPGWPNRFRNHPRQKPEKGIGPDGHQCGYRNDRPARRLGRPETSGHGKLNGGYQQQGT